MLKNPHFIAPISTHQEDTPFRLPPLLPICIVPQPTADRKVTQGIRQKANLPSYSSREQVKDKILHVCNVFCVNLTVGFLVFTREIILNSSTGLSFLNSTYATACCFFQPCLISALPNWHLNCEKQTILLYFV